MWSWRFSETESFWILFPVSCLLRRPKYAHTTRTHTQTHTYDIVIHFYMTSTIFVIHTTFSHIRNIIYGRFKNWQINALSSSERTHTITYGQLNQIVDENMVYANLQDFALMLVFSNGQYDGRANIIDLSSLQWFKNIFNNFRTLKNIGSLLIALQRLKLEYYNVRS